MTVLFIIDDFYDVNDGIIRQNGLVSNLVRYETISRSNRMHMQF